MTSEILHFPRRNSHVPGSTVALFTSSDQLGPQEKEIGAFTTLESVLDPKGSIRAPGGLQNDGCQIDTIQMHPTLNTKEIKLDILSSIFRYSKTTESERLLLGTDLWF